MNDTNNYPNYIGVEADTISSLKIKLRYTGDSEKHVIVSEGNLISVGHVVNENGVLSYALTMGVVKKIGVDAVRRHISQLPSLDAHIANPYYLVVDRSNTYASDIIHIYIRDIRDITVGPMAEGNFAKGEQSGSRLPEINDANKDMYEGRFFFLTDSYNVEDDIYTAGLYYCLDKWLTVSTTGSVDSSPLVATSRESEDIDNHMEYELRNDVFIRGTNITNIPVVNEHEFGSIVCDKDNSEIRFHINGDLITYQVHLTGLSLPVDEVPPEPETPSNISALYTIDAYPYKEAIITPEYYAQISVHEKTYPKHDTPIATNRVCCNGEFYNIYHRVKTNGDIVIHYPNIEGITDIDLIGSYLR